MQHLADDRVDSDIISDLDYFSPSLNLRRLNRARQVSVENFSHVRWAEPHQGFTVPSELLELRQQFWHRPLKVQEFEQQTCSAALVSLHGRYCLRRRRPSAVIVSLTMRTVSPSGFTNFTYSARRPGDSPGGRSGSTVYSCISYRWFDRAPCLGAEYRNTRPTPRTPRRSGSASDRGVAVDPSTKPPSATAGV